ncbi:conserved hypothetical protein [Chthoniobacter flavus Ellin428]|uniref:Peptidase S9 prolyl oligopeptidase catalytic domain-containing protein n=1 Tax=Chthoniobacter flavus Ellin428 TaxID=497964 RepID=B4D7B6_9BACT|nr:conserved hypothetical protein [Chthoniobacter flavus Ellin428]TCO87091.1 prolyl oligopeptidase family protein [Chthoniobacter flavus]
MSPRPRTVLRFSSLPRTACLLGLLASAVLGAEPANPLPADLAPLFQPPADAVEQYGNFRSPLKFADGSEVKTPADWARRRAEIRQHWFDVMGPWPPLLKTPKLTILEKAPRENFTQCRIEVEIAPGRMSAGYLLIPAGQPKFPAVFVPYYDPETSVGLQKELRDFAYQLARRGFVTMAIGSPGGDARKPDIGDAQCQPLSYLAYIATNCAQALANLPEVDATRIGVVGHSYGGKWSMFASCLSEIFACAAWSDPGIVFNEKRSNVNYWDPWYLGLQPGPLRPVGLPDDAHPRTGAYKIMIEQGMDLTELHALMAPRPFLVSGGAEDTLAQWPALNHAIAVNRLLGFEHRVGLSTRPKHDPTPESNEQIYRFFEHFLKPSPKTP